MKRAESSESIDEARLNLLTALAKELEKLNAPKQNKAWKSLLSLRFLSGDPLAGDGLLQEDIEKLNTVIDESRSRSMIPIYSTPMDFHKISNPDKELLIIAGRMKGFKFDLNRFNAVAVVELEKPQMIGSIDPITQLLTLDLAEASQVIHLDSVEKLKPRQPGNIGCPFKQEKDDGCPR